MKGRLTKSELTEELSRMRDQARLLDDCKLEMQSVQDRYKTLLESAPDAMLFVTREGRIFNVNAQLEKLFGYEEAELVGKDLHILIPERYRDRHRENLALYFANPRTRPMGSGLQIYGLKKDGAEFPADISLSPIRTERNLLAIASIRDITERKAAEMRIERNYRIQAAVAAVLKRSLEAIPLDEQLNNALDLILGVPRLSLHSSGSIYLAGDEPDSFTLRAFRGKDERVTPCEKIISGKCICGKAAAACAPAYADCIDQRHEITHSGDAPHGHYCVPIVSGGQALGLINIYIEEGHERAPEEEMLLVAVANTLATVIVRHQVETERNKFKEQLAEAERLAALGRITANVAHAIRNPLTAIGGFARRLDKKVASGSKEQEYARYIKEEVGRLEHILSDVLSLSRGSGPRLGMCSTGDIVEEVLTVFEGTCRERLIRIARSLEESPVVQCARERIMEALENLIANAIDAMPEGGILTVETGREVIEAVHYATIRVSDTGTGVDEGHLSRIFEPFFTTKTSTDRVGLGLPITKRFVEDHGGTIRVQSKVGVGTTFTICLPL